MVDMAESSDQEVVDPSVDCPRPSKSKITRVRAERCDRTGVNEEEEYRKPWMNKIGVGSASAPPSAGCISA